MKNKILTLFLGGCMFAAPVFLSSCNNGNKENESENKDTSSAYQPQPETSPSTETTAPKNVDITISATGNTMTEMKYDQPELKVPAGATVHLTLKNTATDKSMQHNWVLVNSGKMQDVATAGMTAGAAKDWVPDGNPDVLAHTKVVGPGEQTDITFTAPATAGTYDFVCTYPGHWQKMNGKLIVE